MKKIGIILVILTALAVIFALLNTVVRPGSLLDDEIDDGLDDLK